MTLRVFFTGVKDDSITNFEKIDFSEAVKLSEALEMKTRELGQGHDFIGNFTVVGEKNEEYYTGSFHFGSYEYRNLYFQIIDMSKKIAIDKDKQADKLFLLEEVERSTPAECKVPEKIDKTLINLEKSNISKFKKWQRTLFYIVGGVSFIGLLTMIFLFSLQKSAYEKALADGRAQVDANTTLIEEYEARLLNESESLIGALENKEKLSEKQTQILVMDYLEHNEYEKAVDLVEGDANYVEALILTSKLNSKAKREKIVAFNEIYPTNDARFDLAYIDKDYELMLNLENINMTVKRSEMKTYALLKIGKIDEAKIELNNNTNEDLAEKVTRYEVLTAELKTLKDKLTVLKKESKDKEASELQQEINKKNEELTSL